MKGLADKGEREEKRRNEGQKGLGDMNPLTHITITPCLGPLREPKFFFACGGHESEHFSRQHMKVLPLLGARPRC